MNEAHGSLKFTGQNCTYEYDRLTEMVNNEAHRNVEYESTNWDSNRSASDNLQLASRCHKKPAVRTNRGNNSTNVTTSHMTKCKNNDVIRCGKIKS
jgi:hypothetical protein